MLCFCRLFHILYHNLKGEFLIVTLIRKVCTCDGLLLFAFRAGPLCSEDKFIKILAQYALLMSPF